VLLGPVGALGLVHRQDLAVARAAAAEGVPMIFSNHAAVPMEVCAGAMGDSPRWFQLDWTNLRSPRQRAPWRPSRGRTRARR
jgi:L-lactate dehydrogenase (cytochrome)